ncbi:MAG: hypothetical protein HQM00_09855 [Magnetococcales bacterium]|nr:hypothetical protein [Magnetococcales bacterium]
MNRTGDGVIPPTAPAVNAYTTARLLLLSFLATILIGTTLLALPVSHNPEPVHVSWIDALFTATSAVCVTGLTVLDTGTTFSRFGQGVILLLIQVGGLGILTFSTFFIVQRQGRRGGMEISQRLLVETAHGNLSRVTPRHLLTIIVLFTLGSEALGSLLLWWNFAEDFQGLEALWMGVFHAVSAFCNAGFGLLPDNLIRYRGDWGVNLTIMTLIILGGLGFLVVADLLTQLRTRLAGKEPRFTLHTRLVLRTSAWLIVLGWSGILLAEWGNRTPDHPSASLILESLFLSVTSRTAGFNTVLMDQLTNTTLLLVIVLMFIGGSPGSTAGGIKTTTLAVCHAVLRSRAKNRPKVECLERTLSEETVARALMVVGGYLLATLCGVLSLQMVEEGSRAFHETPGNSLLAYLFETVSALGTVGLTTGLTASLSGAGKGVVIMLMFIGRVGPLLLATVLIGETRQVRFSYPEESVNIG